MSTDVQGKTCGSLIQQGGYFVCQTQLSSLSCLFSSLYNASMSKLQQTWDRIIGMSAAEV